MSEYKRIYKVDSFANDLDKVFGKNQGERHRYLNWLSKQLYILDEIGIHATYAKQFEVLKDTDPKLYALRYPHNGLNERYICIYCDGEDVLLLTAFRI